MVFSLVLKQVVHTKEEEERRVSHKGQACRVHAIYSFLPSGSSRLFRAFGLFPDFESPSSAFMNGVGSSVAWLSSAKMLRNAGNRTRDPLVDTYVVK